MENLTPPLKCFHIKVICIKSAHIAQAKASHFKESRKFDPPGKTRKLEILEGKHLHLHTYKPSVPESKTLKHGVNPSIFKSIWPRVFVLMNTLFHFNVQAFPNSWETVPAASGASEVYLFLLCSPNYMHLGKFQISMISINCSTYYMVITMIYSVLNGNNILQMLTYFSFFLILYIGFLPWGKRG